MIWENNFRWQLCCLKSFPKLIKGVGLLGVAKVSKVTLI